MTDLAFRAKGYPNGINLVAKGYENGSPIYLWSYGNYTYELETTVESKEATIFNNASYEEAVRALEYVVDNGEITFVNAT